MKIRTKQINFINWVLTEEERGIIIRSDSGRCWEVCSVFLSPYRF